MSNMPLIKYFQNEINRLFDRPIFNVDTPHVIQEMMNRYPQVDIEDQEKNYVVKANLPGFDKKTFPSISIKDY